MPISESKSALKVLKVLKVIGARWNIGMPSACSAADPGSNPGGARNDYTNRLFSRLRFVFGFYGSVGWQTIAGRLSVLEALKQNKS